MSALAPRENESGDLADVTKAAVFLASDDAACVAGVTLLAGGSYTPQ